MSEIAQNSLLTAYIYQKQVKNSIKIENIFSTIVIKLILFDLEFLKKETHQQYIVYFFGIVDTSAFLTPHS